MKNKKQKLRAVLSEALGEILVTLICFGIGAGILALLGVHMDSDALDFDLIVLIGIVVPAVLFGVIAALVQCIKKAFGRKRKETENENARKEDPYDPDHRTDL